MRDARRPVPRRRPFQEGDAPARFVAGEIGVEDQRPPAIAPVAGPKVAGRQAREFKRHRAVRNRIRNGEAIYAADGVGYIGSNITDRSMTLRRAIPKVRGQAARKALKRERQRERDRQLRRQSEVECRDGRAGGFDVSEGTWSAEGLS